MKQFELSKNTIIIVLISIIFLLVVHDVLRGLKVRRNEAKSLYVENSDCDKVRTPLIEAINYLQDENERLVFKKDSIQTQNFQLKKKVNFYFEFYSKHFPPNK